MKPDDFSKEAPGQVIRVGQGDLAYWAYAPAPLPPRLQLDAQLWRVLSSADRAIGELGGLGYNVSNPHLLMPSFMRLEAVLSSRIEGTQTDMVDLYAYEAGQLVLPGLKPQPSTEDTREVLNYVRALEYGIERMNTLPLSLRLIRELHERLMRGVRGDRAMPGEFRRSQNWIGRPGSTLTNATYVPPPVSEMLEALGQFEKYLYEDDDLPPLVRLALIHYQFEAIHPFIDGNGRIGRLLISLLLVHWKLLPFPLLYLSAYFERRRQDYYDLLLAISQQGSWREWVMFFLQGVAEQAQDANAKARELQSLQKLWYGLIGGHSSAGLLLRTIDLFFKQPIVSASEIQQQFGVTHRTANKIIRELQELSILHEITGRQRNRIYQAEGIVRVLEQPSIH